MQTAETFDEQAMWKEEKTDKPLEPTKSANKEVEEVK
jgi:hypothetical protein